MPRLSRIQEQTRRRIIDLTARCLAPEVLGARLLDELRAAIPFDGGRLFGIDPATLLVNRVLAATDSDGWARLEWLREVYLAAEPLVYLELPTLMRAGLHAVAFHDRQDACWGYPRELLDRVEPRDHFRLFHELRSPVGGTLHACFSAAGRWVAALQIYRRDPARPFRAGDVAFLRLLAPAIGNALHGSLARERAVRQQGRAMPEATGVLLLGPDRELEFATPAAEAWLSALYDARRQGQGALPSAVWSAVAALRAGGEWMSRSTVTAWTPAGPVRVEASPGGPDGSVAVVLAPERPPAPPAVPEGWPLTNQQRRIVGLLLRGMSNHQIAATLEASENTVEWHLRAIYDTLGVRSRTQLLARLFQETYEPSLVVATETDGP
jgi:DNA-binding CsgD family transcriptional regulator/GAF domain-containing protein